MSRLKRYVTIPFALFATLAFGQSVTVLPDLDAQGRVMLTKDELSQLLPNAKMSRVSARGNRRLWTLCQRGS